MGQAAQGDAPTPRHIGRSMRAGRRSLPVLVSLSLVAAACGLPERASDSNAAASEIGTEEATDTTIGPDDDELTTVPTAGGATSGWDRVPLELTVIAELTEPVAMTTRATSADLYVAERAGVVRRIERSFSRNGAERISLAGRAAIDISELVSPDPDRGLTGLAFSTDGRLLYVSYVDLAGDAVIDEYRIDRSTRADPSTRREILRVALPTDDTAVGHLTLGADGFLYLGLGDADGEAQDVRNLLGSVVRIDPIAVGEAPYTVPNGNPFSDGDGGLPEIFLWGVHHPWRFSFDRGTGDLWLADIGERASEINALPARTGNGRGADLGWPTVDGLDQTGGRDAPELAVAPVYVYAHEDGRCGVAGGYVYGGELVPVLTGVYVFGDRCSGEIFGLQFTADGLQVRPLQVRPQPERLVSFGQGPDGELYVLEGGGQLLRARPQQ